MNNSVRTFSWPVAASLAAVLAMACSSMGEKPAPAVVTAPAPMQAASAQAKKVKTATVEGVISGVGQRTITFRHVRKGKVREEVVGVDDKTDIEKSGAKVKLRDLAISDKGMISYQPNAYTPALSIKITGKGNVKKGQ